MVACQVAACSECVLRVLLVWPAPDGLLAGWVQLVHDGTSQVLWVNGGELCGPAYIEKHTHVLMCVCVCVCCSVFHSLVGRELRQLVARARRTICIVSMACMLQLNLVLIISSCERVLCAI